jgi:hypothetical protein
MRTCKLCGTPTSLILNADPYCGFCYSMNGGFPETEAMQRAKRDIIEHLIQWLEGAEKAGQSPAPISFGSLVYDDLTFRDLVELARGKSSTKIG